MTSDYFKSRDFFIKMQNYASHKDLYILKGRHARSFYLHGSYIAQKLLREKTIIKILNHQPFEVDIHGLRVAHIINCEVVLHGVSLPKWKPERYYQIRESISIREDQLRRFFRNLYKNEIEKYETLILGKDYGLF